MSGWGFGLTVAGLVAEAMGLGFVALGIRKRVNEYGDRALRFLSNDNLILELHPRMWKSDSEQLTPQVREWLERLEGRVDEVQEAAAHDTKQVRQEMVGRIDEQDQSTRQRESGLARDIRRVGLGDVRGDWMGFLAAAGGVVLTLIGTTLSYLA